MSVRRVKWVIRVGFPRLAMARSRDTETCAQRITETPNKLSHWRIEKRQFSSLNRARRHVNSLVLITRATGKRKRDRDISIDDEHKERRACLCSSAKRRMC